MSTPVKDDDWGSPTLYPGSRPIEPRMFTEADPMASGVLVDWDDSDPHRWGETTLVGKTRRRDARRRRNEQDAATPGAADATASTGTSSTGTPSPRTSSPRTSSTGTPSTGTPSNGMSSNGMSSNGMSSSNGTSAVADGSELLDDRAEPAPEAGTVEATEIAAGTGVEPGQAADALDAERSNRGLLAASGSMAVASLASRVTGFVRSILLLAALGTGAVGDAYNSGNNLPNMIYELLLGGVLSSVLIPLLVQAQSQDDDDGVGYTQRLLSIASAALGALTLLAVAAAPLIAAGFVPAGPQRQLTSVFATLLLPEIFFYGLGAMFMAVLNIRHVYKPGAWSPVLNNVIMIVTVGIFFALPGPAGLDPRTMTNTQVLVIGIGTTLGIAAQALVLIPSLRRSGFTWRWRFRATPAERGRLGEVGSLAGWVLAYVVISQIGVVVIQRVGVRNGGFTVFTNADLLFQMPYGILVVSLLTAIMPRLSRAAVRGDNAAVLEDLSLGARLSAIALIPVTFGLIVLGPAMTVTLFAYGNTSIANAHLIGSALAWSAFGLFPFALVMLQLRVFYAMRDGRTPTVINAFMVAVKVVLVLVTSAVFAAPAGTNIHLNPSTRAVEWLNISTSVSYVIGAVVGHIVLTRRLGPLGFGSVARTAGKIVAASVVGAAAAYAVVFLARDQLGGARLGSWVGLVGGGLLGLAVLAVVAWRLRIPDLQQALAGRRHRESQSA